MKPERSPARTSQVPPPLALTKPRLRPALWWRRTPTPDSWSLPLTRTWPSRPPAVASASGHIPDLCPNLPWGDKPGDQAETERQFARAEVCAAGFRLKSWQFSRNPKTSSAPCFPLTCWENWSSLPGAAEWVGTWCLCLQHGWRPAPPQGQKEIRFELQAQEKEMGFPIASVTRELPPFLSTLTLTCSTSCWLQGQHRSLQFLQCLGQPPQTCPQSSPCEGMARIKIQRLHGIFSWREPFSWSWDPSAFPMHVLHQSFTPSSIQHIPSSVPLLSCVTFSLHKS